MRVCLTLTIIRENTLPQFYIIDCCYTYTYVHIYYIHYIHTHYIYIHITQDLTSRDTCRSEGVQDMASELI